MPDLYTYPGTEVLINLPGYTHFEAWKAAQAALVQFRMAELLRTPLPGRFDLHHLQAIHRHLTQDLYAWAGELRQADTGPGGAGLPHCRPQFIEAQATRVFGDLADMDFLTGRGRDTFSTGLAWVWGEATVLHPFRDVNTRSQFVFFSELSRKAGWAIDWSVIDPYVFGRARTVAMLGDESGLDALLHPALLPVEEVRRHNELRDRLAQAQDEFFIPHRPRTVAELDSELDQARRRRARHP